MPEGPGRGSFVSDITEETRGMPEGPGRGSFVSEITEETRAMPVGVCRIVIFA